MTKPPAPAATALATAWLRCGPPTRNGGLANLLPNATGSRPTTSVPSASVGPVATTASLFSSSQPPTRTSGTCSAAVIAARSEPAPLSLTLVTTNVVGCD